MGGEVGVEDKGNRHRPWPEEKGPGRWAEGYTLGASVRQEAKGDFDKPRGGKL